MQKELKIIFEKVTIKSNNLKRCHVTWHPNFLSVSSALHSITLSLHHFYSGEGNRNRQLRKHEEKGSCSISNTQERGIFTLSMTISLHLTHTPAANSGFEERMNHRTTGQGHIHISCAHIYMQEIQQQEDSTQQRERETRLLS